ncbi:MAG: DNA recombination protein RmuC [Ignavibacteriaceae bacterium]
MDIITLLTGIFIGLVVGWLVKSLLAGSAVSKSEYEALTSRLEETALNLSKAAERNEILDAGKRNLEDELKLERQKVIELSASKSALQSDYNNLQKKLDEQKEEVEKLQEKFSIEFENLANRIFKEKSEEFSKQSKTSLENLLTPLKDRITEFQNKVEQTNKESIDRLGMLRQQLMTLKDMNQQMSQDAQNLVKALKGDTKAQGDWGEIQLERILERSGLRKGEEYLVQESFTTEEGRKRPDVIVNLPEDKKIIIDSKVSLVSYERFVSAEDDEHRSVHIRAFIESVRRHIKELSEKNYQSIFESGALDFVLMFIPIEPAFSLAVQYGDNLYVDAYDKNIVIVSPSTLLATLRTIANIWKQEYQNRNVLEIARQSGALYDKFVSFVDDLTTVGNRIDQAKNSYEDAMKKLYDGSGNLVKRAEKIRKLGAKTSKSLPPSLINRADNGDSDDE